MAQLAQMHVLGTDIEVVRVEQEQHLRADQGRFDGHVRECVEPQYRFRFAEDVVVHQDDVGVLVERGHLVEAAGEAARTTEIRLPDVPQLVTEDRRVSWKRA